MRPLKEQITDRRDFWHYIRLEKPFYKGKEINQMQIVAQLRQRKLENRDHDWVKYSQTF